MLAAAAVVLALTVLAWAYGVYCYVQMVRHRQPGVPALSVIWPAQNLTERGLNYRRRALLSYGAFVVLALVLIVLGALISP
jgi:predicted metal-binding membrane protein